MRLFCHLEKKDGDAARSFLFLAFPPVFSFSPFAVFIYGNQMAILEKA
jgi:hypothetical protein